MPTTVGRSRGRQGVHSGAQGAAGDHMRKIVATLIAATAVVIFVLVATKAGHTIDAATQHFMLYYAGVLALVGLTGSVLMGLVATDRIVMTPGHRVMAQAVHRAFAFGTLAFLIIHITTEILAQRSHVIDAAIPFLSPYRTFYIGLGTIASDLIVLLVVTSILRKRFTGHGRAWQWRAIHYGSYVAFVFGVLHGLLGGRAAKPYVDWSYGFAIAVTALGLAVRFLAISLRPKETLGSSPSVDRARPSGSSPLHAAAMSLAQTQLSGTVQVLPAGMGSWGAAGGPGTGPWAALPAPGWSPSSGPLPALDPAPAYAGPSFSSDAYRDPSDAYRDLGFTPLGAPPWGNDVPNGLRGRPYLGVDQSRSALAGPPPAGPMPTGPVPVGSVPVGSARPARQPLYEPGYDGPPRFEGAPRGHGDVPADELSSYPYGPQGHRPPPALPYADPYADRGRIRRAARLRRADRFPARLAGVRAATTSDTRPTSPGGPELGSDAHPRNGADAPARDRPDAGLTGRWRPDGAATPRPDTGPMPRVGPGQVPRHGSGPMPRAGTGPMPRAGTGPMPRADSGPMPRVDSGPMPRVDSGPMPRVGTGPMPRPDGAATPRPDTGPMPRVGPGQVPRHGSGPMPRAGTGPMPRANSGPMPRMGTGPMPRPDTGPMPRPDSRGELPRSDTGPMPRVETGPLPRPGAGPMSGPDTGSLPRPGSGPPPRPGQPAGSADPAAGPRTGPLPAAEPRSSHRAKPNDPRYRDIPRPIGGEEWE